MNITSEFFSFNVWEWFLYSLVLEWLNLTYRRLIGFVASLYFIPIVLVSLDRFSLCHTPIDLFWLFRIRSQSWLWVAWPRGLHQWRITFEEASNVNTNPLPYHVTTLKASMDEIYEMPVRAGNRKSNGESWGARVSASITKKEGYMIDHCEDFHNEVIQMLMRTSWSRSRNPHAKTPIPGKPSKSGLIWVWHKDNFYQGTTTIRNGAQQILIREREI
jgi:hypothetical protein